MILYLQNNTINVFSSQNPLKTRYYTCSKRCLLKMIFFRLLDLEIDLLTLKMTLNNQNNFRNGLPSQNHITNEVLHLFLASFVENAYLTFKLTFDLEYTKMLKLFKLALIRFEFSTKKSIRNIKKNIVYVTKQG